MISSLTIYLVLMAGRPTPANELRDALERLAVMTRIRVSLTGELRSRLTAAEYTARAHPNAELRHLLDRDAELAKASLARLSRLLVELTERLDVPAEREAVRAAFDELNEFGNLPPARADVPRVSEIDALVADARVVMRDLEAAAAGLAGDLNLTAGAVRRVNELLTRAERLPAIPALRVALRLERLQLRLAPLFARHSLSNLCRSHLVNGSAPPP